MTSCQRVCIYTAEGCTASDLQSRIVRLHQVILHQVIGCRPWITTGVRRCYMGSQVPCNAIVMV